MIFVLFTALLSAFFTFSVTNTMYFINLNVIKLDRKIFSINAYNIWKQLIVTKKIT